MKRDDLAIMELENIISKNSKNIDAYLMLADIHKKNKNILKARSTIKELIKNNPGIKNDPKMKNYKMFF